MDAYTFTKHFSVTWGNSLHECAYGMETTGIKSRGGAWSRHLAYSSFEINFM